MLDLKDYVNEVVYTSFESFITKDSNDKKQVFVELLDY
ncbi:putative lipoprotein [Campylobacter jejuni subsp. jejuni 414]|nr:putative lipoprotein [Campylobacter jejuni subsp. jejuni 414]